MAELVELDGRAALLGAVASGEVALDHSLRAELVVTEPPKVFGFQEPALHSLAFKRFAMISSVVMPSPVAL